MRQSLKRFGFALVAGALLAAPGAAQSAAGPATTLAVLDFTNSSLVDHATYEPFSRGIGDILITELSRNQAIRIVERDKLVQLLDEQDLLKAGRVDPTTAARLGRILGAQYVLTGGFVIDRRQRLRLDVRAVNVETSEVTHVETAQGGADDLLDIVAKVADQMNRRMDLPPLRDARPAGQAGGDKKGRMKALLYYSTALVDEERMRPERAKENYERFLKESDPSFAVEQRHRAEERLRALAGT